MAIVSGETLASHNCYGTIVTISINCSYEIQVKTLPNQHQLFQWNPSENFTKLTKMHNVTRWVEACQHLKSPRSLSGRSLHLTSVTKWSRSWSWMTYSHPISIGAPILRYSYFKIWPWKPMVKVMCVVKGQSWNIAHSIFNLEKSRSRSRPRSNLMVTFEALSSIDMFAFRSVAIIPFLAEI